MFRGHSGEKAKEPMGAQLLVTGSAGHTKAFPVPLSLFLSSRRRLPDHPVRQTATALQACATLLLETAATTTLHPLPVGPSSLGTGRSNFSGQSSSIWLAHPGLEDVWL